MDFYEFNQQYIVQNKTRKSRAEYLESQIEYNEYIMKNGGAIELSKAIDRAVLSNSTSLNYIAEQISDNTDAINTCTSVIYNLADIVKNTRDITNSIATLKELHDIGYIDDKNYAWRMYHLYRISAPCPELATIPYVEEKILGDDH